tara:strand:- start:7128 stop:7802 length:675 start_codon:yes stop_codon:yes gene_type:complete
MFYQWYDESVESSFRPYFFTKNDPIGETSYELFFIEILGNSLCIESGKRGNKIDVRIYTPKITEKNSNLQTALVKEANELINEKILDGYSENNHLRDQYEPLYIDNKITEIEECGNTFKKIRQMNTKRLNAMLLRAKLQKEYKRTCYTFDNVDDSDSESDVNEVNKHDIGTEDLFGSDSESESEIWNAPQEIDIDPEIDTVDVDPDVDPDLDTDMHVDDIDYSV